LAAAAEFYTSAENQPKKKFGQAGAAERGASPPPPNINSSDELNVVFRHLKLCFADFKATRLLRSVGSI